MAIEAFLRTVIEQRTRLDAIEEYDQFCTTPRAWLQPIGRTMRDSQRRGWTRRDKIRCAYNEQSKMELPSRYRLPPPQIELPKRLAGRVSLIFRLFSPHKRIYQVAKPAMEYCKANPHTVPVGVVANMLALHVQWLDYIKGDKGSPSAIEADWDEQKNRLAGVVSVLEKINTPVENNSRRELTVSALAKMYECSEKTIRRIAAEGLILLKPKPGKRRGQFASSDTLNDVAIRSRLADK